MTGKPESKRMERFTMLEMGGPVNPSPEELATRVVALATDKEGFTALEMGGPVNPSPEELATRVVDLATDAPARAEVPGAVLSLVAELAAAVAALDARTRAAALDYISAELPKRTAG